MLRDHDRVACIGLVALCFEVWIMELKKSDWETVKGQVEQEQRTILISLAINQAALSMIEAKIRDAEETG